MTVRDAFTEKSCCSIGFCPVFLSRKYHHVYKVLWLSKLYISRAFYSSCFSQWPKWVSGVATSKVQVRVFPLNTNPEPTPFAKHFRSLSFVKKRRRSHCFVQNISYTSSSIQPPSPAECDHELPKSPYIQERNILCPLPSSSLRPSFFLFWTPPCQ